MQFSFAIIGCGNIGTRHAALIQSVGKLVAVCDIVKTKAEKLGTEYSTLIYLSIEELLANEKKPDVVVICTPNGLHAAHTLQSLQAGCHVLCEKPMAINSDDCRMMIAASENSGKKLFIVKQNRFNPPVVALKEALDKNKLGKIFSIQLNCFWNRTSAYYLNSWRGTMLLDGGILFTQFSHFIDLLYWLFGDVKETKSFSKNFTHQDIIEFEDTGVVIVEFKNGVIGTIHYTINSYKNNMEGSITVIGEKGTVKIGGQYLNVLQYQHIDNYEIPEAGSIRHNNDYGDYQGSMSNHDQVYKNLLEVLNGKAEMTASGYDGLKTVEIIEKINASARFLS